MAERLHEERNRGVLLSALHVPPSLPQRVAPVVALKIRSTAPVLDQVVEVRNRQRLAWILAGK